MAATTTVSEHLQTAIANEQTAATSTATAVAETGTGQATGNGDGTASAATDTQQQQQADAGYEFNHNEPEPLPAPTAKNPLAAIRNPNKSVTTDNSTLEPGSNQSPAATTPTPAVAANDAQDLTETATGTPATWDAFLASQPEPVQQLYHAQTKGLKNALDAERQNRKDLEKKMGAAAEQLKELPELQKILQTVQGDLQAANQRANFYQEAPAQGVADYELAFIAAQNGFIEPETGAVNWEGLKVKHAVLFKSNAAAPAAAQPPVTEIAKKPPVAAGATAGAAKVPPTKQGGAFNEWLRKSANK